jgi:hypothetical protein
VIDLSIVLIFRLYLLHKRSRKKNHFLKKCAGRSFSGEAFVRCGRYESLPFQGPNCVQKAAAKRQVLLRGGGFFFAPDAYKTP